MPEQAAALDVLGIGTSPLMLIRAIRLAEKGRAVTLADRAVVTGGGWAAPALLGLDRVELGAHVLENRPALMLGLARDLGAPMARDPCVSLIAGHRMPMGLTRAVFHAGTAVRALARGEVDKARRGFRSAWRTAADAAHPYRYPQEGAAGLVAQLARRFLRAGGVIRHGLEVRGIDLSDGVLMCETEQGPLRPRLALISSRAWAPVTIDGQVQPLVVEHGMCWNTVLRLSGASGPAFSYVEILGDPLLKRVRDISAFARPGLPAGERLLVIQTRREVPDADAGRRLAAQLLRLRLLDRSGHVVATARTDARLATLTDATLRRITRRAAGRIETLATSDFAEGYVSAGARVMPAG